MTIQCAITETTPLKLPDYVDARDLHQSLSVKLFEAYSVMGGLAEETDSPVSVKNLCDMHHPAGLMRLSAHEMLCALTGMFEDELDYLWRTFDLFKPLTSTDTFFEKLMQQTRIHLRVPTNNKHHPKEISENISALTSLVQYVCDYYQQNPDFNNPSVVEGLIQLHNQIVFCAGILGGNNPSKLGEELFMKGATLLERESKQIEFERIFTQYITI